MNQDFAIKFKTGQWRGWTVKFKHTLPTGAGARLLYFNRALPPANGRTRKWANTPEKLQHLIADVIRLYSRECGYSDMSIREFLQKIIG